MIDARARALLNDLERHDALDLPLTALSGSLRGVQSPEKSTQWPAFSRSRPRL